MEQQHKTDRRAGPADRGGRARAPQPGRVPRDGQGQLYVTDMWVCICVCGCIRVYVCLWVFNIHMCILLFEKNQNQPTNQPTTYKTHSFGETKQYLAVVCTPTAVELFALWFAEGGALQVRRTSFRCVLALSLSLSLCSYGWSLTHPCCYVCVCYIYYNKYIYVCVGGLQVRRTSFRCVFDCLCVCVLCVFSVCLRYRWLVTRTLPPHPSSQSHQPHPTTNQQKNNNIIDTPRPTNNITHI